MTTKNGYKIVLTGDKAAISNYRGFNWIGFIGCMPSNYPKAPRNIEIMESIFFATKSDSGGKLRIAPYGIRKIEAALRDYGFSEDEVVLADPRKLDKVIGPDTKVVGLTVHDPMGYAAVSQLVACTFRLISWWPAPSYTAIAFDDLIQNPSLKKYGSKLIIGGPGIWQLEEHPERFAEWGIDCLVEGEAEGVVGQLFEQAVKGEKLPEKTNGHPMKSDKIPLLKNPSSSGIVEITRGCGRGCQFCSPDLLMFRSVPKERIMQEVDMEVKNGLHNITLHSEDALFYGRKMGNFEVNHDAIIDLWKSVKDYPGVNGIGTDFFACSTIKSSPRTLKEMAEIMEIDGRHPGFVETGLETVSPHLVKMIMPGKVKPYTIEEWPEIIDDALGILDDNHWFTVASMMTGLPKETEADVIRNMEFIDDIKHHNVFVWMFPLMPLRSMRKQAGKWMPEYTPLRQELILRATVHSVDMINRHADLLLKPIPSYLRYATIKVLKYVSSKMVQFLKEAEGFIETEDRLNLYKDLNSEVTSEGEAVMHVSNVVKELINIPRSNLNPNKN
ncbi:MAG: B12-binding domain-containing radical SAM protein [Nitrososphaerales archaeon]